MLTSLEARQIADLTGNMQNDHHWLQMRNIRRMEERVRVRLRRRIVPDRSNPFEDLAEEEFLLRFRLSKECVLNLLQNITEQLPIAADARGCPIPQHLQIQTQTNLMQMMMVLTMK
ncbi:hypothetical protein Pcinc_023512 [Petrolisthes cinctipes]|uniref:Uncharacterized protein n=1 Tax=Petrolisthes cinctipes TaxID=88211 RepID=A0AAE1FC80_PETCI|nr:hypothetical protein Pcinc_023512 [Petrolisthes cinctipes]